MCSESETDFEEFTSFLTKLIVMAELPSIKSQKYLNDLKDK